MPIEGEEEKDRTGLRTPQKDSSQGEAENPLSTGLFMDGGRLIGRGRRRFGRGIGFYSRGHRRGRRGIRPSSLMLLSRTSIPED